MAISLIDTYNVIVIEDLSLINMSLRPYLYLLHYICSGNNKV